LCYDNSEKKWISCKFNYTLEDHEYGKRQKICLNGSEAELTEKLTEEILTEQIKGKLIN
jgi:RecB family endonuclease NucS